MGNGQAGLQEGLNLGTGSDPVALMIQTRITDAGTDAYQKWQVKVGQILAGRPGFISQEVIAPNPPVQVDWFVIQRFRSLDEAQSWLRSEELSNLLMEVEQYFVGSDNISLSMDSAQSQGTVSAIITCKVMPENEARFQDWEREVFRAEAKMPGFLGHKLDRPIPGIQDNWVIVLTFASDSDLDRWLESPERKRLLEAGSGFSDSVSVRKTAYGFDFWFRGAGEKPVEGQPSILEGNLLVLLVLYPIVFLWGFYVSDPYILGRGVPFWAALFIGNVVSTQLMGWWVVPWIMRVFAWWFKPGATLATKIGGYVAVFALYALSMGVYAYLISTLPPK
jgi:antibiotic biosynthesis monooxygenase (ABM) superfamily enzyme